VADGLFKFDEALAHGEYERFRDDRQRALNMLGAGRATLSDYDRVLAKHSGLVEALAGRAVVYLQQRADTREQTEEYERLARKDFARSAGIDSTNLFVRQAALRYPQLRGVPRSVDRSGRHARLVAPSRTAAITRSA
jgi:hypothetical protein